MPDVSNAAQLWGELYALLCKKPELQNALGGISESELARLDDLAEKIIEKYLARDQEVQVRETPSSSAGPASGPYTS